MNMKIEILPRYRMACIRQVGPYGSANEQTMRKLKEWAAAKNLLSPASIVLGVSYDDPETTPPESCRYDAGLVLADNEPTDGFVAESELPGGKYAIYQVKHTAKAIQQAWGAIFADLSNRGYQIDRRPMFERYREQMLSNHNCEICVPLK
ncbi:AraC family transcriptional regulator [Bacillus badius]|uniref:AraC family transcriptional regulator n=1 Tax=Bacillus badius TaxID=1455 RepID=UPI000596AE54|nr:GyrI-like domain-containing protein [Bacillus badius]